MTEDREKDLPFGPLRLLVSWPSLLSLGQYDAALKAMNRAEELCPVWREEYTGPFITIIKENLLPIRHSAGRNVSDEIQT